MRKSLSSVTGAAILAAALCGPTSAVAAAATSGTFYVSPSGSDTAAGTSQYPLRTLGAALAAASGGRIVLAAGSYPAATDTLNRSQQLDVVGPSAGTADVAGLSVLGGTHVSFSGMKLTGKVLISTDPRTLTRPAHDVRITDSEITTPGLDCLTIRNGVSAITVDTTYIHDCHNGITGPAGGTIPQSSDIDVTGNTITRLSADGIQFGQWDDVTLRGNAISEIVDPGTREHDDGIQLTGNSRRVTIDGNRIFRSKHQLVFIQDAIGPISDVTVTNNTMVGAGATAVQIQGVPRLVFVHNTVWDGTLGGVWLRQGYLRAGVRAIPRDAIITDNILDCLRYMDGTGAAVEARNFIGWAIPYVNTLPVADPGFTDPLNDDYSIRPGGAAQGLGAL